MIPSLLWISASQLNDTFAVMIISITVNSILFQSHIEKHDSRLSQHSSIYQIKSMITALSVKHCHLISQIRAVSVGCHNQPTGWHLLEKIKIVPLTTRTDTSCSSYGVRFTSYYQIPHIFSPDMLANMPVRTWIHVPR